MVTSSAPPSGVVSVRVASPCPATCRQRCSNGIAEERTGAPQAARSKGAAIANNHPPSATVDRNDTARIGVFSGCRTDQPASRALLLRQVAVPCQGLARPAPPDHGPGILRYARTPVG